MDNTDVIESGRVKEGKRAEEQRGGRDWRLLSEKCTRNQEPPSIRQDYGDLIKSIYACLDF